MADFDLEQLKTLFQNLADRLANTKGDENTVERLAALEQVMRKIQAQIASQGKKKPSDADQRRQTKDFIDEFFSQWKQIDPLKDLKNQGSAGPGQGKLNLDLDLKAAKGGLKGFASEAIKSVARLGKGVDQTIYGLTKLDGSMTGLVKSIGITGGVIATTAQYLDDNIKAYRDIQLSSEGTINSFKSMHEVMAQTSLNTQELAAAMTKGSDGVRVLGGMNWGKLNADFKAATREVGYFGMSWNQITEAQSQYLGMLKDQGTIFEMNNRDMVDGMQQLITINDRIAGILGKNRQEMLDKQAEQAKDANFGTWMRGRGMDGKNMAAMQSLLGSLEAISPRIASIVKEGSMLNGGLTGENAQAAAVMSAPMRESLERMQQLIRSGNATQQDIEAALSDFNKAALVTPDDQQMGILGALNGGPFADVNQAAIAGKTLNTKRGGADGKRTDIAEGMQKGTGESGLMQLEGAAKQIASTVDAGINKVFDEMLAKYGPHLTDATKTVDEFTKSLKGTISALDGDTARFLGWSAVAIAGFGGLMSVVSGVTGSFKLAGGLIDKLSGKAATAADSLGDAARGADAATDAVRGGTRAAGGAADATRAGAGAADAASDAARTAGRTGGMADDLLKGASKAKGLGKALGMLGPIIEGVSTYGDIKELYAKKERGEIDEATFKKEFSKSLGKGIGGAGGGIIGAELGAMVGGAGGTAVAPGVGTLIGGGIGAITGGLAAGFAGEAYGEQLGEVIYDLFLKEVQATAAQAPSNPAIPTAPQPGQPAQASPTTPTQRPETTEVPLTHRDLVDPFANLQTALVGQMEKSNDLLSKIELLLKNIDEKALAGNAQDLTAYTELIRLQEELTRNLRINRVL